MMRSSRFAVPGSIMLQAFHQSARCEDAASSAAYYGSYVGDRFGGGIGRRVGIDESQKRRIPNTGVSRIVLLQETHEQLKAWATSENWKEATRIHKAAYFTRTENLVQEAVLEKIRSHYVSVPTYEAQRPVQAALFRLEDDVEFKQLCEKSTVDQIPMVVRGVFDERAERCIVDFANKRLGGGWLSYGMVQEEKMFIERFDYGALCARSLLEMPDPISTPLASPFSMHPNEAWVLRGGVAFAHVPWYGRTPPDGLNRLKLLDPSADAETAPAVVAIDAIKASFEVYEGQHLRMMLVKAFTGFVAAKLDPDVGGSEKLATGSWGCGAFYNNERVIFVIQALAANLAGVELTYHVLGDGLSLAEAFAFLESAMLRKCTISQVLHQLEEKCQEDPGWRSKFSLKKGGPKPKL